MKILKYFDTVDGGVRITIEMCRNCKIGNKMLGSLVHNVQYGRGTREAREALLARKKKTKEDREDREDKKSPK
jgi:hypothetical protein